jgi:hypothetical protein
VLGVVTASGKAAAVNSSQSDGSQTPDSVLAVDIDAAAGDAAATVYLTGEFAADALAFGGNDTAATHAKAMRGLSMFVKTAI